MNRKEKILEQMDLLGIMDVTTTRQHKNGTIIWKLPIKKYGQLIEVGSFASGYVRRMDCKGYRGGINHYQINKRKKHSEYHKYNTDGFENPQTAYYKIDHYNRILIPIEIDRLEYLISYCLKNYYINQANMIEDGKFVPKWKYEDLELELQDARNDYQDMSCRFEETSM